MSGRISDIVIHPENENLWYVTQDQEEFGKHKIQAQHGNLFLIIKKSYLNWMYFIRSTKS